MELDDLPHQRKPQAHAAVFPAAGLVHPEKGLENAPLKVFRDAPARVGHPDQQFFRLRRHGKAHGAAGAVILDGVLRQVEQ